MKKDLTGLRKFIYNLDTAALEAIMDVISRNDSKAFMKMYPRSQGVSICQVLHMLTETINNC